jgi:FMN phosphatase YigB (HAD superfamily)
MKISNLEQINKDSISNIIFDWGGVITELDFKSSDRMFNKLGVKSFSSQFSISYQAGFLIDFELGKISPQTFREEMRKLLHHEFSDHQIDEAWNAVIGDTPVERIQLLMHLGEKYNLFLLSNTNKIHTDHFNQKLHRELGTNHSALFEKVYYSYSIGIRKPDVLFFTHVLANSKLHPQHTLFIDDTEMHVDAAARSGIYALHLHPGQDIVELFKDW